jgi:catechol 2,3-dioxygenase-like lactoylglutathione lyase family enzyme
MRRFAFILILLSAVSATLAQENSLQRPPILGISHIRFHVTQTSPAIHFYQGVLGLTPAANLCENAHLQCFWISHKQFVQLDLVEQRRPSSLLEEVAFVTPDLNAMRKFLESRGVQHDLAVSRAGRITSFSVLDPEGNRVVFEEGKNTDLAEMQHRLSSGLMHAGFVVHDRAAEDGFYKDILGFHVYWHGGRKDDETSWVDMQVPDGTDWIEYMLNVPASADHHTLGVMNHIALGVPDIQAAEAQLRKNGWSGTEKPKIGRDGKWQLNLYDPDDTRVEFMEFRPIQKPCCAEYTGPHPKP